MEVVVESLFFRVCGWSFSGQSLSPLCVTADVCKPDLLQLPPQDYANVTSLCDFQKVVINRTIGKNTACKLKKIPICFCLRRYL